MLTFRKARQSFEEIRSIVGRAQNDPIAWDMALGLEALTSEMERRLTQIERAQQEILRLLRQQK